MKQSSLLISVLTITTIAGIIFAQNGGTTTVLTVVEKMKAASHDFILTTELNQGQTDIKSGPLSGKKMGGIVTAEEYNRILEMLSEGGGGPATGGMCEIKKYEADCTSTGCTGNAVSGSYIYYPKRSYSVGDAAEVTVSCGAGERLISGASFSAGEDESVTEYVNLSNNTVRCHGESYQADEILHFYCQAICMKDCDGGTGGSVSGCTTWIQAPKTLGTELSPTPFGLCRFTASGTGFPEDTYYGAVFQNNHANGNPNSGDVWSCGVFSSASPNHQAWLNQNGIGATATGIRLDSTKSYGFEYCIGSGGSGGNSSGSSMIPGWPDAIMLDRVNGSINGKSVFYATHLPSYSDGKYMYELTDNDATQYAIIYNADGTFSSRMGVLDNLPSSEYSKSITQLRAEGKAFNFVGEGGGTGSSNGIGFGGTYAIADEAGKNSCVSYNNPKTGGKSCPAGTQAYVTGIVYWETLGCSRTVYNICY